MTNAELQAMVGEERKYGNRVCKLVYVSVSSKITGEAIDTRYMLYATSQRREHFFTLDDWLGFEKVQP